MSIDAKTRILFVCMGNICRSPTAEGVFRYHAEQAGQADRLHIDSAGTHAYHIGERPDERASAAALKRGIDLSKQKARRVSADDFQLFDYVIAMDSSNIEDLAASCPPGHESKMRLFMEFAPDIEVNEVPDPYYGGATGFERVLDLIELAAAGLLAEIRQQHRL